MNHEELTDLAWQWVSTVIIPGLQSLNMADALHEDGSLGRRLIVADRGMMLFHRPAMDPASAFGHLGSRSGVAGHWVGLKELLRLDLGPHKLRMAMPRA